MRLLTRRNTALPQGTDNPCITTGFWYSIFCKKNFPHNATYHKFKNLSLQPHLIRLKLKEIQAQIDVFQETIYKMHKSQQFTSLFVDLPDFQQLPKKYSWSQILKGKGNNCETI